jgi:hypothetical protein
MGAGSAGWINACPPAATAGVIRLPGMEPSCDFFVSTATRRNYRAYETGATSDPDRTRRCAVVGSYGTADVLPAAGGRGILALSEDKKIKRKSEARAADGVSGKPDRDVGHALRSVYSNTVNEEIPSELLDLLGKLD